MSRPAPHTLLLPTVPALQRAMALLELGLSVIPVKRLGKTPMGSWAQYQKRRPEPEELVRAFRGHDDANTGIVTGELSGVIAVDTDDQRAEEWARKNLPETPMRTRTSKGYHRFFRHPGSTVSNRARITVNEGTIKLDVRGDGGLVVAPGSTHETGAVYEAIGDWTPNGISGLPVFDPEWLDKWSSSESANQGQEDEAIKGCRKSKTSHGTRQVRSASTGEASDGLVHEGERNSEAFNLAIRFRRQGLSEERALGHLVDWNRKWVRPPLPNEELQRCLASAYRPEYLQRDEADDEETEDLPPGTTEVTGLSGVIYQLRRDGLYRKTSQKEKKARQIANFFLQVEADKSVQGPSGVSQELDLVAVQGESRFPVTIAAADFPDNRKLKGALMSATGARLNWSDADFSHIRSAAICGSRPARVQVYQTFGLVAARQFVSPSVEVRDGKIIIEGRSRCELAHIPNVTIQHLDLRVLAPEAVDATLHTVFTAFVPQFHRMASLSLLGLVVLAPSMDEWKTVFNPFVLFLRGASGVRKSTAASFCQCFFGSFSTKGRLLSFASTVNAIEGIGGLFGGAVMVIDDYKRQNLTSPELASKLLQTYADQSGRDRMNRSADLQASRRIKGLLVVTGEDVPEGETSVTARCIRIDMDRHGVRLPDQEVTDLWTRCRMAAEDFRGITPEIISWLHRQPRTYIQDLAGKNLEQFSGFIQQAAPALRDNRHRVTSNFALALAGVEGFLAFSVHRGVLTSEQAAGLMSGYRADMMDLLLEHGERVPEERPAEAFLEGLRGLLASREVRILPVSRTGGDGGNVFVSFEDPESFRSAVGYQCVDTRELFILPSPALDKVKEHYRRAGRHLAFSQTAIGEDLLHLGYLVAGPERGRQTTRVIIDRHRVRVWTLTARAEVVAETTGGDSDQQEESLDIIEPDDDPGPGGPDGPPDG